MDQMFDTGRISATPIRSGKIFLTVFLVVITALCTANVLSAAPDDLFPYRDGSTCMYFNRQGEVKLSLSCSGEFAPDNLSNATMPNFIRSAMGEFEEGMAPLRFSDGKWRFIDQAGTRMFEETFDDADRFSGGLARIRVQGAYGYIDRKGRTIISPRYSRSGRFVKGLAYVQCDSGIHNFGYIDLTGKQILPCKYQEAFDFTEEGLAKARMWDLYGYIDVRGTAVLNFAYKFGGNFEKGRAFILKDEGFAFIDRKGKRLIEIPNFDLVGDFGGDLAPIRRSKNLRWGFIDQKGRMRIPAVFFEARSFRNGLALVQGPRGYTDTSGMKEESIPTKPGELEWFYIDVEGRRLFPR